MCKKKKGRLTMRIVREVIRLIDMGLSSRKVARSINISPTTVAYYKKHFIESGLSYDEITKLDDDQVKDKLRLERKDNPRKSLPDMAYIHKQLSHKGVTLKLLWEEYMQENDLAYKYSQFASYYREFKSKLHPIARFNHKMGEKVFVDFSGYRPTIVDPITGQTKQVELFVGVLGSSVYTHLKSLL
jgi:transposase